MKFLVLWRIELALVSDAVVRGIARMPEYGRDLEERGKVLHRYHVVGAHGGAWIYDVDSHEEFERLLAISPVFNFATYTVHALAEMPSMPYGVRGAPDGPRLGTVGGEDP